MTQPMKRTRALDRIAEMGGNPTNQVKALQNLLHAEEGGQTPASSAVLAPVVVPPVTPAPAPSIAAAPAPASMPPAATHAAAAQISSQEEAPQTSQRTSVLLTGVELDILDRMRGMRLPSRVRLNDSDIIRAAMQHLNTLTDAQIAEILSRTAPLRRGRK